MTTLQLNYDIPQIASPESRMFGYPTRLADAWTPRMETVVEDACASEAARLTFSISHGTTGMLAYPDWTRNPLRRARRRMPPIDLGKTLILDSRWDISKNYSLFLLNVAERVLVIQKLLSERGENDVSLVVLVQSKCPESLTQVLDALNIRWIATDAEVQGRVISQNLEPAHTAPFIFIPELWPSMAPLDGFSPERVFINRKIGRTLTNDSQIVEFLRARGFHICTFEGMPIRSQWAILRNAREVVAIHGAGITNMLFNRLWEHGEGPKFVEIFPAGYRILCFRHLVSALGGSWCAVRSQVTPEVVRDLDQRGLAMSHLQEPINVHLDSLAAALEYLD